MKSIPAPDLSALDQTSATRPRRALNRRAPAPLALEPRIMFDGATADAAVAAARAAADVVVLDAREAAGEGRAASFAPQDLQVAAAVLAPAAQRQEIVFVVDNVPDYQKLVAAVQPGIEVVVLDHTKDGLQQMITALDGRAPVDAIHLVTHGDTGRIELGATAIADATLQQHAGALAALGTKLAAGADLLVYGCDVAAGSSGQAFIGRLGQLTGADVAASTDVTGSAAFGNWTLEARSGAIETGALAFEGAGWTGALEAQPRTVYDVERRQLNFDGLTAESMSGSGTGRANGDVIRFKGVITIDNQAVDAVVTTFTSNANITDYDEIRNAATDATYFQQNLTTTQAGGSATFRIDFYKADTYKGVGTGTAVTLQNVVVNSYDIDSLGGSGKDRQFQSFKGFSRYELSNNTTLKPIKQPDGTVTFQYDPPGSPVNNPSSNPTNAPYRVRVYYDSMSSFEVNAGVAGAAAQAFFSFDFSLGPAWNTPTTTTETPAANISYEPIVFTEAAANDGAIGTTTTITLKNGSFAAGLSNADVQFSNVPAGLSAQITRIDATHASLTFTGKALAHADANDISNFGVAFKDSAFTGTRAADVVGAVRADLEIDFNDPPADNTPPVVAANQRFEYAENRAPGAGAIGTVQASDTGGAVSDFRFANGGSYTQISADGYFSIDSSGRISLTAAGRGAGAASNDFETGANSFTHNVVAYDAVGNRSTAVAVTLALTNIDELAPSFSSGASATVDEGQRTLYTAQATDTVDFTDKVVGYSLKTGGDAGLLQIDAAGKVTLRSGAALDYETKRSYSFTVIARDQTGNTSEQAVTIDVAYVDEAPPTVTITADRGTLNAGQGTTVRFTFSEAVTGFDISDVTVASGSFSDFTRVSATEYTALYTPGANLGARDVIIGVAVGRFADLADNANQAPAELTLRVDTAAPVITGPGTAGNVVNIVENTRAVHTFSAQEAVTWSVEGADAARFEIGSDGALRFTSAPDFENPLGAGTDANSYLVTVRATDALGNASTRSLTVTVGNADELAPAFTSGATAQPLENQKLLYQAAATDTVDFTNQKVAYSLGAGGDAGLLEIDAATGAVTLAEGVLDFEGKKTYTFDVVARDDSGNTSTRTVTATVADVNEAPTAGNGSITTAEDTIKSGTLPAATDPDAGDTVTYAKGSNPAHGTVVINPTGTYLYAPAANYHGADSFTYTVSDGKGGSNTYTMSVTVTPVNDAPTASDTAIELDEDGVKEGSLPAARDVDGDPVSYTLAADGAPLHGDLVLNTNGSYTYTPERDFHGADSFKYTVSDGKGGSNTYTVTVTVKPLNDAPTAANGNVALDEDTPKAGQLPEARDAERDPVSYALAPNGAPAHGRVEIGADGSYLYTPDANFHGSDSFQYTVSDGQGGSNTYTMSVTVAPVNDLPTASDAEVAVEEDTPFTSTLPPARDAENDPVTYAKASDPAHGTVTVDERGNFTYTPSLDYNGLDSFTYTVSDGKGTSVAYTITLTVGADNDAPVALDTAIVTDEDQAFNGSLPVARDADGDLPVYALAGAASHGQVTVDADGKYRYVPAANYHGADSFTYKVSDGKGGSNTYTVNVTVNPVNDAPTASDARISTVEDQSVTGKLPEARDVEGQPVTYAKASDPAHGTVTIDAQGNYTYTPHPDYSGIDRFTYTVSDGAASTTYTVTVEVGAHNDAPVGLDAALVTAEDTPYSGVLPAASDADGDRVSYALSAAPAHGSVAIDADGRYTYTPAADFHGKDSFRYTISDGNGGSASYTVDVTVTPVNDAPVSGGNGEGRGTVGQPLAPVGIPAFTDVDGPSIGYTATLPGGAPLPSWLAFDPDTRSVSGTPPAGSGGTWTVVVTGSDGSLSSTATVRIVVSDPAAPAQTVTIDSMSKDTGRSALDFITSDGSAGRTVNGSIGAPLGANEVVQVSFDGGATWQQASTSGNGWSAVDGGAHNGDWTIVARVTNTAAGLNGPAASVGVVLDTILPAAPTVDTAAGASTTPVLTGSATVGPGETLQVTVNGKDYAVTPVDGRWTLDLAGKDAGLTPGQSYPVTAVVIDPAGNVRSGDGSVRVDAPPVPEVPPVPVPVPPPPAPPAPVIPAPVPEAVPQAAPQPTPVQQAVDTRVNTELAAPGSLVGNDNTALYGGIGTRAGLDSLGLGLRGAALSDIYTRSEGFRTVVASADEPALVLFQGVPDQFAESGRTLSLSVPADAFVHTQDKAIVRLAALMQDGQPLPSWVHFNGETGKFSGEVPKGYKGELKIKVIARDHAGREAVALFRINVGEDRATTVEKAPAGKPDLSAQLRATSNRALLRRA